MADNVEQNEQVSSTRKLGRPMKFQSVDELQMKIDAYFGDCDPHIITRKEKVIKENGEAFWKDVQDMSVQKPYTTTGLAIALGTNRLTLINYENPEHYSSDIPEETVEAFINTIKIAKAKVEGYAEAHLFSGKQAAGAIFNLVNNHNWVNKQDLTSGGKPLESKTIIKLPYNERHDQNN